MNPQPPYLLDTNILVELIRGKTLGKFIDSTYQLRADLNRCLISVVTIGEALSLVRQFNWGPRNTEALEKLLDDVIWIDINNTDVFEAYAEIDHLTRSAGTPMGKNDVWIAATTKATGATLLTTDMDFTHVPANYIQYVYIDPASSSNRR